MDFQTLLAEIDRLTPAQRQAIKLHIEQYEQIEHPALISAETPAQRLDALEAAFTALREGLTEVELADLISDMNSEYLEPIDDSAFEDNAETTRETNVR